jgi:beta-glucosidase
MLMTQPPGGDSRFISRYIEVPNDALFPFGFGFGLSYTNFSYGKVSLSRAVVPLREANDESAQKLMTATVTVTNSGSRAGTENVQRYVRNLGASVGFQQLFLIPRQIRMRPRSCLTAHRTGFA